MLDIIGKQRKTNKLFGIEIKATEVIRSRSDSVDHLVRRFAGARQGQEAMRMF